VLGVAIGTSRKMRLAGVLVLSRGPDAALCIAEVRRLGAVIVAGACAATTSADHSRASFVPSACWHARHKPFSAMMVL
jgi:hypothetical protein